MILKRFWSVRLNLPWLLAFCFFFFCLLFSIFTVTESGGVGFWPLLLFAVLCGGGAVYQLYGKGSVVFGIKTAVQTVILHGVNTRRRSDRTQQTLAEKIEAVQGRLSIDELREAIQMEKERERGKSAEPKRAMPPPLTRRAEASGSESNPESSE